MLVMVDAVVLAVAVVVIEAKAWGTLPYPTRGL
jgi:hypothetical protein